MPSADGFAGDQKSGDWWFARVERRFVKRFVARVPRFLETYHLTLLTVPWCLAVIAAGWAAASHDLRWLWVSSAAIALQYVTDLFDGAVGRHRDTGLIKWGFHMDHLLDFAFLFAILIGYSFLLPSSSMLILLFMFAVAGAFMVNAFLEFAATNQFKISQFGVGPTELRLAFIGLNGAVVQWGPGVLTRGLPWALGAAFLGLCVVVYRTQRKLWDLDMASRINA